MHALDARDGPAELLPGGGIGQALLESPLSQSERQGGDADAAPVERVQELPESVVHRSEDVLLRHDGILEDQLARVGGSPAELVFFFAREYAPVLRQIRRVPNPNPFRLVEIAGFLR